MLTRAIVGRGSKSCEGFTAQAMHDLLTPFLIPLRVGETKLQQNPATATQGQLGKAIVISDFQSEISLDCKAQGVFWGCKATKPLAWTTHHSSTGAPTAGPIPMWCQMKCDTGYTRSSENHCINLYDRIVCLCVTCMCSMSLYIDIVIETYKLSNIRQLYCSFFIHSTCFSCGNQAIFHEVYLRTKKYGWAPCWIRWLCVSAMTKPKLLPAASEYVWNFKNASESSKKSIYEMHFFHNRTGPKMVIVRALLRVNLTQASCGLVAL